MISRHLKRNPKLQITAQKRKVSLKQNIYPIPLYTSNDNSVNLALIDSGAQDHEFQTMCVWCFSSQNICMSLRCLLTENSCVHDGTNSTGIRAPPPTQ